MKASQCRNERQEDLAGGKRVVWRGEEVEILKEKIAFGDLELLSNELI